MERSVEELVGGADVEALSAGEVLDAALERLHPSLALACSFQKEESVLIDMLLEREPKARIFTLDTHVLFPESYALWHDLERRYKIRIEVHEGPSLGRQAAAHGDALWARNPDLCCSIRKLAPLSDALSGLDGWITGVRRDQAVSRAATPKLGWDDRHELWKASPLADWTDEEVWGYVRERELPVNPLHARGYASIGCTHCTAPGTGRDGRWAGTEKTECGLHA
jgi:phosphoadenosine phosphosulfate reductase